VDEDALTTMKYLTDALNELHWASETSCSAPIMEAERQVLLALKLVVDNELYDFSEETSEV